MEVLPAQDFSFYGDLLIGYLSSMKPGYITKTTFTLCLSLWFWNGFAQVEFFSGSLKDALGKAANESKFVMLQFEAANCERCNDVANKSFENAELTEKLAQAFVCLRIGPSHPEREQIAAAYRLTPQKSFGSLFLDYNGTLLHSYFKTTTSFREYIKQIEATRNKAGEVLQIGSLEREYTNGNRSFGFLEILLQKRRTLNIPTDTLLDEYIDVLPADSLKSARTIAFIAQMAPMLDSKADKVMRADKALFNRAWYSMSLPLRVHINNRVIYKGMEKAIKEKNESLALRTASFARATNTNATAAAKAYDMNMLRYYEQVNDTTAYFRKAIAYYEHYLLTVVPDSVKKVDSLNMRRIRETAKKDTVREGNRIRISTGVRYQPIASRLSGELNSGAYNFHQKTNNPYLLSIATEWSKRALEFFESPDALLTYAKLLYKQNRKEEAQEKIARAIELEKKRGLPTKTLEAVLEKMKSNGRLSD
ncbi:MAG TPA: hypothetical protein VER36_08170 [Flavisolibacter sp.]|nr:hypothetical protein [Flavisolibacter sp.]